ncbi:exopolyphosphatase [Lachnoclostridium sp. An14]|uniref:Ppx/GppA phosphatase family protein n=1 Tax=Lachnoclostridium sp. An14 TaxID=1965562 RepID=UPI000B37F6A3|nr:exopolyphosphatase [Lachnoclostridium sp. An14]OUQ15478.1 exopolyphosphatase [Lachnoclostridium sp. An14]
MAGKIFAAIDIGSFELELGIYEISTGSGIRQVDHVRYALPLGSDTYQTGIISYRRVEEMCRILGDFVRIADGYQADTRRAYATSALREAKNNRIVLDQIRVRTGLKVKIISNSEQRFLTYKAIAGKDAGFNRMIQKGTATVDVGFGGMQISLFDKDALVSTQNLPLGVMRLRSFLNRVENESRGSRTELLAEMVDNELFTFRKMYLKDREIKNVIATGNAVLHLARGFAQEGQGELISAADFKEFYNRLSAMSRGQKEDAFGVSTEYASLLVPSAAIYQRVMELTGAETLWIPGVTLLDGMAAEYGEETKLVKFKHDFSGDIIASARNMAKRYKCHIPHIQALEEHALGIFDAMKKYHGMGKRERLLLQIAVNLHSCGKFISVRDASDCAYNIIMGTEIIGLSHAERETVANVVRYNLQPFSYEELGENSMLVAKLVAILRLANSMDRSHKQKLAGAKIAVKDGFLTVSATGDDDITPERIAFEQKEDFFEEIYGIRPVLKQKRRMK